jgi:hypothetical protein
MRRKSGVVCEREGREEKTHLPAALTAVALLYPRACGAYALPDEVRRPWSCVSGCAFA